MNGSIMTIAIGNLELDGRALNHTFWIRSVHTTASRLQHIAPTHVDNFSSYPQVLLLYKYFVYALETETLDVKTV